MRWILIILLMCNGIYFLWHSYMLNNSTEQIVAPGYQVRTDSQSSLVLISEAPQLSDVSLPKIESAAPSDIMPLEAPVAGESVCWLIGPFKEIVSGKQVIGRLDGSGLPARLTNLTIEGKPDYWVHLAPQVSRRAAIKLLRELQSKKIDSFLITKGELENGISLGFFTQKSLADKVYQDRLKQGYQAVIKAVPRTLTQIWVVAEEATSANFTDQVWDRIREGYAGLERRKNNCDKIASVGDLD